MPDYIGTNYLFVRQMVKIHNHSKYIHYITFSIISASLSCTIYMLFDLFNHVSLKSMQPLPDTNYDDDNGFDIRMLYTRKHGSARKHSD